MMCFTTLHLGGGGYHRLGTEEDGEYEYQDLASLPNSLGKIDVGKQYYYLLHKYFVSPP